MTELSKNVGAILNGKYDRHVPEQLLRAYWASRHAPLEVDLHEFCHTAVAELAANMTSCHFYHELPRRERFELRFK